ncbi:PilZ domain-containing protein [Hydrogenivirga caldilitoris]|uniref:PilZ domain-containing protein n=1 Tax=Hydrogenivirga caldilitoris TaxID=246264 RepID=A0A497XM12_9AQUI|nr:PilZ domain-containing protein [Hydrogenivirga caldilitoris]RLJ69917.1 PilZ domain-containing protein [Hydrogenivirga caldilitoris]
MSIEKAVEIFIFEDSFFFTTKVSLKRVEGDRLVLSTTDLLKKFAVLGKKAHLKYSTFALPVKIVGKSDTELIVTIPSLNPEKPVGDRRSARVPPSHVHPVKLFISVDGEEKEYEVDDISEGGFSVVVSDPYEVDKFLNKDVKVHIDFPVEVEEVKGSARLVNVLETEDGKIKLGFELFIDDADMVKVRFYVYSRIREILRQR